MGIEPQKCRPLKITNPTNGVLKEWAFSGRYLDKQLIRYYKILLAISVEERLGLHLRLEFNEKINE